MPGPLPGTGCTRASKSGSKNSGIDRRSRPLRVDGHPVRHRAVAPAGHAVEHVADVADDQRPLRFWHMLIESNTFQPMFKSWSPMSIGSWALLIFGIFAFISFLGALADANRIAWAAWRKVHPPSR